MWTEIWIALALVLVLEGILPFAQPQSWRKMVRTLSTMEDKQLRMMGLFSMLVGVGLLYLIR